MSATEPREVTAVLDAARASGLLPAGEPVLALVSGGQDSVCLLDVAIRLAGARAVRVLHVNYALRAASSADERHCRALCERLGVGLDVAYAPRPPKEGNLQAWAREFRYLVARRSAETRGARIATGHTSSDQAETVLYRLASSPSRRALLGMPQQDGPIVRPLLDVSREQTAAYCEALELPWREDESNASDKFARNRLRVHLLPALKTIHPAAEENVVRVAEVLRDEATVLDEAVEGIIDGRGEVPLETLRRVSPALARLVVTRLAEEVAGRLVPRVAARTPDILALADDAALDVGEGTRARVENGVLRFEPTPPLPA